MSRVKKKLSGKRSICINFLYNTKWRSIAWLSMFWSLHIFISVQQICHLVNGKRKFNSTIFTIWNSHCLTVPEAISRRSHTSLSIFRVLGQFREMVKSSQIMGMNKVLQNTYPYFTTKLVSFKLKDHVKFESCQF